MVWDNSTRAELSDFLDTMCNHKESVNLETIGLTFSSHRNELIVGNIFIRVFNEQPHYTIKVKLDFSLF
jgi:DnaJ family protein C protein 13